MVWLACWLAGWLLAVRGKLAGCWLAVCCLLLAGGHMLLADAGCCWLLIACCLLLLAACSWLMVGWCWLIVASCCLHRKGTNCNHTDAKSSFSPELTLYNNNSPCLRQGVLLDCFTCPQKRVLSYISSVQADFEAFFIFF
jgi:hypothetical protein